MNCVDKSGGFGGQGDSNCHFDEETSALGKARALCLNLTLERGGSTPLLTTRLDASLCPEAGRQAGPSMAASSRRTPNRAKTDWR
jgi:hypothetical protein